MTLPSRKNSKGDHNDDTSMGERMITTPTGGGGGMVSAPSPSIMNDISIHDDNDSIVQQQDICNNDDIDSSSSIHYVNESVMDDDNAVVVSIVQQQPYELNGRGIMENDDVDHHNDRNESSHNTSLPFVPIRNNRAPPTMAFFRNRWNTKLRWNNRHDGDGDSNFIAQQQQQQALHRTGQIPQQYSVLPSSSGNHPESQRNHENDQMNSEPNDDDPTSSLLSQQQGEEEEGEPSLLDRCYRRYCEIRQILVDPETYEHLQRTIRRSGNYIAYCTVLVMLILVPTVLYRSLIDRKLDIAAIHSARVMVIGTIIMSLRLVYLHLTHWFMPDVQKYVVRILWMVPIYAIQSYLSLRYHHARVYMSTIRDFYEAFVITSFVYYLMELLGGQDSLIQILQNKDPRYGYHKFPISLVLQPWVVGEEFLLQCKHGVLQYVVFKTTATILIFICEYCGVYGEGHFEWFVAYPYLCFFQNFSVMYALYCLVIFFHACNEELHSPVNWHPLGKFLCIKGVVFFTWWQGVIIFYLRDHGIIGAMGPWSSIDVANGFIDYCIVVEMVGFAIAHSYTFTYTEYLPGRFPHSNSINEHTIENEFSQALLLADENCPPPLSQHQPGPHYRPPSTLPERMRFRDALWSSTVPHETLQDIQRLRAGVVDSVMNQQLQSRGISRGISLSAFGMIAHPNTNGEEELVGGGRSCDPESEHPLPETETEVSFI